MRIRTMAIQVGLGRVPKGRQRALNLGISAISILGSLLLAEMLVRAVWPQPTKYYYFKFDYSPGEHFYRWDGIEVRINSHGERDRERMKTTAELHRKIKGFRRTYGNSFLRLKFVLFGGRKFLKTSVLQIWKD